MTTVRTREPAADEIGDDHHGAGEVRRRRDLLWAVGLALTVTGAYAPSLGVGFYSEDYFWLAAVKVALQRPSFLFTVVFRDFNPVMHLSLLADWLLGGGHPLPYHLTALLLHGLNTALVMLICRRFGFSRWLALVAALTWGLNVRLSEAVIWPAARGHPLATLCILAATYGVLAGWRLSLPGLLLVLGLLSKESAFFPMLALPLFAERGRRIRTGALVASLAIAFLIFNSTVKPSLHLSHEGLFSLAIKAPFIVLRPIGLGDLYPFSVTALILVGGAYAAVTFWLRHSRPGMAGLAWVALAVVPVLLLPKLSSRYLYLPAVGYALLLAALVEGVRAHLGTVSLRRLCTATGTVLLALVLTANVIRIQHEIADYHLLAAPYQACVQAFTEPLRRLEPGDTVIVYDLSPRDAILRLNELVRERGNMRKLIPYRANGVGGLIRLSDLVNVIMPPTPGLLATPADPGTAATAHHLLYDGRQVRRLPGPLPYQLGPHQVFAATWGDAAAYRETAAPQHTPAR